MATQTQPNVFEVDRLGSAIALSSDGLTLAVGANGNNNSTGHTKLFNRTTQPMISLSIQGLTANAKIYDATTVASVSGNPLLSGVTNSYDVSLEGTPVYAFDSKNVGTGINITTTGWTLSGADAANYTLTQPTLSSDITTKLLSVATSVITKEYDGTTTATLAPATLEGVESGDEVSIDTSPTNFVYSFVDIGPGIPMSSSSSFTITRADVANYRIEQQTFYGDINPKILTVEGLTGVVENEDVNLADSPIFTFASAAIETAVSIATSGFTLACVDIDNYQLTQPTLSADITSTLGLEVPTLKALVTMYPNPVKDQLTIESNKQIEQIRLLNVLRQEVKNLETQQKLTNVDVSNLKPGVYFVNVTIGTEIYTHKIIKN